MDSNLLDFVNHVDKLKIDSIEFLLSTRQWQSLCIEAPMSWNRVKFTGPNRGLIPAVRGVYAFLIAPDRICFPPQAYLIYVGETGNESGQHLRSRFGQYLQPSHLRRRPALAYALTKWEGWIDFAYVEVPEATRDLKVIEAGLNDTFVPPCVTNDFSAEVRQRVRAFRL